jgi:hypothetical protein
VHFLADRSADNRQPLRHGQTHQTNTGECQAGSDADITNSSSIKQAVILTQLAVVLTPDNHKHCNGFIFARFRRY